MSTNLKIARASFILILASFSGHAISLVKEILVADRFGVSAGMDAFYAAITIPNLLNSVFVSFFSAVFIPILVKQKLQGKEYLHRIISAVASYGVPLLLLVSLILAACSHLVIAYGFRGLDPATAALSTRLLRFASFSIILSGCAGILSGVFNSFEQFSWPSFSQIFVTVSTIVLVLLFSRTAGVSVLVYGLLAGLLIQVAVLYLLARSKGFVRFTVTVHEPELEGAVSSSLLFFAALMLNHANILVDRVMASFLPAGSIAALGYADKLIQVPLNVFAGSIAVAALPYFSSQAAENKLGELKDSLEKSLRMAGFIFIPLTIILIILAEPIIRLMYQRGAFTSDATHLTAVVFGCYAAQLLFFTATILFYRAFLALRDLIIYVRIVAVQVVLNILLNFLLMRLIHPPAAGIALSTSLVLFVSSVLFAISTERKIVHLDWRYIGKGLALTFISSLVMGLSAYALFELLEGFALRSALATGIIRLFCSAGLGIVVFLAVAYFLKIDEVQRIYKVIRGTSSHETA